MKTTRKNRNGNGYSNVKATSHLHALLTRVESAEKIFEAARSQWRLLKVEHKQARRALKEAKKAAKCARREVKAAAKSLRRKGLKLPKPLKPATLSKFLATRGTRSTRKPVATKSGTASVASKRNGHPSVLPSAAVHAEAHAAPVPAVQLQA